MSLSLGERLTSELKTNSALSLLLLSLSGRSPCQCDNIVTLKQQPEWAQKALSLRTGAEGSLLGSGDFRALELAPCPLALQMKWKVGSLAHTEGPEVLNRQKTMSLTATPASLTAAAVNGLCHI